MRKLLSEMVPFPTAALTVAALLLAAGPGSLRGQVSAEDYYGYAGGDSKAKDKAKPKSQLEQWLEQAARTHPDIKVAEAKLREAAAELERARSLVMEKVVSQYHALRAQKIAVEQAELELARLSRLADKQLIAKDEITKAEQNLMIAKAKLEELQAQMDRMVGKGADDSITKHALLWLAATQQAQTRAEYYDGGLSYLAALHAKRPEAAGPMAERIRKALDTKVSLPFNGSVDDLLEMLHKKAPDLLIQIKLKDRRLLSDAKLSAEFKNLPLGAVLQWVEDSSPGTRFVVREYGLLLTSKDAVPPGAVPLVEFWKTASHKGEEKKPADNK